MNAAVSRSYNGWEPLFSEEFSKDYFKGIKAFLEREYAQKTVYPPKKLILNAFDLTAPQDVKVVILGLCEHNTLPYIFISLLILS